jgi:curved DNA-binding protein CbpA
MSAPEPVATGTLDNTPLPHLLVYALDRRLTGTLVIEAPGSKKSALWFYEGAPAKAKTAEPIVHLGRLLLEMGAIDEATHNHTLSRVAKERLRHGRVLLEEGVIDEATLEAALREQLARQVIWMFTLPTESAYGYYAADFLGRWGGPVRPLDEPLALLWRGVRSHADPRFVEATLARLGEAKLRLHADAQPSRFRFSGHERGVVDVLCARPHSLRELIATELTDAETIERIVYVLTISRHVDVGAPPLGVEIAYDAAESEVSRQERVHTGSQYPTPAGSAPPARSAPPAGSAPPARSAPPVSLAPADASEASAESSAARPRQGSETAIVKDELRERASATDRSYYELLGVPRDAATSTISAAFFELAKRLHPDRLGPEYADTKPLATKLFSRLTEAHQILCDEERRKEYDELLESGGGSADEQEQVQRVLRAATAFRKAEVLLKKHNLAAAEEEVTRAVEDDPDQGDYIALLAWVQAQKPERQNGPVEDFIQTLSQVIDKEPENARARWYRGQLYKRAGKEAHAVRDFRWVLERSPRHLDAAREVRLYEMRRGSPPGGTRPSAKRAGEAKKDDKGLFGKFFKR